MSGTSLFLPELSGVLVCVLLARITNHSLQRLLLTSAVPLITFGGAKLVNEQIWTEETLFMLVSRPERLVLMGKLCLILGGSSVFFSSFSPQHPSMR